VAFWTYSNLVPQPGGVPRAAGCTIDPSGVVWHDLRTTEPGGNGEMAVFVVDGNVVDGNVVDDIFAAYLRHHGHGQRLTPMPDPDGGQLLHLVRTPPVASRWFHGEVAAGRVGGGPQLPQPEARRQLRESAGLSRPQVAELLDVSKETVRLWEAGDREPEGGNRDRYLELLTRWRDAGREPARVTADAEPQRDFNPRQAPGRPVIVPDRFGEPERPPWSDAVERAR
jgi:transcriptional regulator with XRE-family HTH domain